MVEPGLNFDLASQLSFAIVIVDVCLVESFQSEVFASANFDGMAYGSTLASSQLLKEAEII